MSQCYVCEKEINRENETEEHILINAIGGTLKSKTLICKKCNSEFGEKIDAELARQLNFFSNMLDIKRDRGVPQNLDVKLKKTGEEILIQSGGKPVLKIPKIHKKIDQNGKGTITITAPNIKVSRTILKGLKRTYNQIGVEDILSKATKTTNYLNEQYEVNMVIGGDMAFRSICKTAINFYMMNNGERKYIEHLIPYIKGKQDVICVKYYYKNLDVIPKNENQVLHSIIIKGNNNEKLLLAYIELFNCCKYIILLNDNYNGSDVNITYYFDILKQNQVDKCNSFYISRDELIKLIESLQIPTDEILSEVNKLQNIINKKQYSEQINKFSQEALENSLSKYPEDAIITSEMMNEFVDELMKRTAPFIGHMIKK